MMRAGQSIWLVGASAGIGAELARLLAKEGARLILSARNESALAAVHASLEGQGHRVVPLDVTDAAAVASTSTALMSGPDAPELVIYNAGAYEPMDATAFDLAAAEQVMAVNLTGAFRVVAAVLPGWLAKRQGHLVLVGSVAGYRGLPAAIGYGASKAGLIHFAENLRADLADHGITVQLVNPGFVRTRLTDKNQFRMPCILEPEEAARRMVQGMRDPNRFEIHFPRRFTLVMKLLALLPYPLYFAMLKRLRLSA